MTAYQPKKECLIAIRAGYAIQARLEILTSMTDLAEYYMGEGYTEEASEILAFVIIQPDLPDALLDRAEIRFDELESRICPRVIYDAKVFAKESTLADMVAYVLAEGRALGE